MAKIVPIYKHIDAYSATDFTNALNDAERFGEDIEVHINTNGGEVAQGYAMLIRLASYKNGKSVIVDGKAFSMGAFFCLFADNVEAYDVSSFMMHKASVPKWYEEHMSEFEKKNLAHINKTLRSKMEAKLNIEEFEKIAKITLDEFFDGEDVQDVFLTAQQAKRIGLISKVNKLNSVAKVEINSICRDVGISAEFEDIKDSADSPQGNSQINNKNKNKMTIDELKKNHPDVVKSLRDEFRAETKSIISAWKEWKEVDADAVIDGIETLESPDAAAFSKFQKKMVEMKMDLENVEEEAPEASGNEPPKVEASGKDLMAEYLKSKGLK